MAQEPGRRGRGRNGVDPLEVGDTGGRRAFDHDPDCAPVGGEAGEQQVAASACGERDGEPQILGVAQQTLRCFLERGAALGQRLREPRRLDGVGNAFEPGLEDGRARSEPGDTKRRDERVAVDRFAEQATHPGLGQRAVTARRDEPEQAARGIETKRPAR